MVCRLSQLRGSAVEFVKLLAQKLQKDFLTKDCQSRCNSFSKMFYETALEDRTRVIQKSSCVEKGTMQLSSMRVSEDLLCKITTKLSANVWCNCLCSVQKSCARCIQKEHSVTLSTRVASISVPNLLKWFCKILFISCTREVSRSAAQKHCTALLLKNFALLQPTHTASLSDYIPTSVRVLVRQLYHLLALPGFGMASTVANSSSIRQKHKLHKIQPAQL